MRGSCLAALSAMNSPAADQILFEKLSETVREHSIKVSDPLAQPALYILRGKLLLAAAETSDRYGDLLLTTLRSASDPRAYQSCAIAALDLPIAKATSVLEQAIASAPTPEARTAVRTVLDQIAAGEVRSERLRTALQRATFGK